MVSLVAEDRTLYPVLGASVDNYIQIAPGAGSPRYSGARERRVFSGESLSHHSRFFSSELCGTPVPQKEVPMARRKKSPELIDETEDAEEFGADDEMEAEMEMMNA